MRASFGVLLVVVLVAFAVPRSAEAQQSVSVGAAVLAPLPSRAGACRAAEGERAVTLWFDDSPARSLSAATSSTGAVVRFTAVASSAAGATPRERQSVTVSFSDDERMRDGERRYHVNGPNGRSADQAAPVTSADVLSALYLAKQVLARCAQVGR